MPSKSAASAAKTRTSSLRRRLEDAQQKLEEAEQTLEAIRSGKVDALVVSSPTGERIFTLQGADHRYRRLVEGMTEGALIVSLAGVVLYANASFAKLVGVALDRVFGTRLVDYVAAAARPSFQQLLDEARAGTVSAKSSLVASDDNVVPIHVSATFEGGGEHDGICVIVTDLTNAMREAQRQHTDEFRQLADNVPELAWHARPDGYIDFLNQRWFDYTGTTFDTMKGWGWQTMLHPEWREAVNERWRASVRSGAPFEMEFPILGFDGEYRWFLTRVRPLRDEAGRIVRWFGTNTNIDDQRREAAARTFLEQASVSLASSLDLEETLAHLVRLPVPELADMCSVFLRQPDGSLAQLAVAHKDDGQAQLARSIHRLRQPQPDAGFGSLHVLQSGQTELVESVSEATLRDLAQAEEQLGLLQRLGAKSWIGVPLQAQGETQGALFFVSTDSARKYSAKDVPLVEELAKRASLALDQARLYREAHVAAEAERRARDKADAATRLKDEFLATLSHELRTPLNAILGWGKMLQSSALEEEQRSRGVDTIVRNAVAQNQLIEDLLDVSRIISGKMRLSVDMVDVAQVVAAAVDVVEPTAEAKGVRLQTLVDPDAGMISGDAARLQQIIWNLLTNAVKFTPKGGRVHISLRRDDSFVELTVSDTGAGISADFLPFVFDRFRQQDATITRKAGGLGLGLAIVKNLAELHGGRVEVSSAGEGLGATFVVRIPIAPVRSTPVPSAGPSSVPPPRPETLALACPPEIAGLKILVLDDERDARELLSTVFQQCGATVSVAGSVPEALRMLDTLQPNVIVSDIGMPEEDGYSFIKKLRARSRQKGGRIPAVALTAYARGEDRTRALIEGFNTHTAKPVDPQELLVIVANLVLRYA